MYCNSFSSDLKDPALVKSLAIFANIKIRRAGANSATSKRASEGTGCASATVLGQRPSLARRVGMGTAFGERLTVLTLNKWGILARNEVVNSRDPCGCES
jgi:hypothetical protein